MGGQSGSNRCMNNVMLAAMLGGWEILLILGVLELAAITALVGGIVFLAVRLARRGKQILP